MPNYEDDNGFIDLDAIPQSNQMHWFRCNQCGNLHLLLKNDDDEIFAHATISKEQLLSMLQALEGN